MKEPCIDCTEKRVDDYGYLCDLSCGKRTMWLNYMAGIREVISWLENNLEPTVPMTLDYRKWHAQLKKWGITDIERGLSDAKNGRISKINLKEL